MSEEKKPYCIDGRPSTIYRVVKSAENPYVMIDRRPIDNAALSFKAKGILTYLMSRPDGWEVSVSDLIKHATDGEASVRSGLKDLKIAGHMKYTAARKSGRITGWLIEVFEVPFSQGSPDSDFQQVENQDVENRTQVLSTCISTEKNPLSEQDMQEVIIEANKAVDVFLDFERKAQEAKSQGKAWRGRELLIPAYILYGDLWHELTGLHMYGAKAKAKIDAEWLKAFKACWENDVSEAAFREAYTKETWDGVRTLSRPSQIVGTAKAIQAAGEKVTIENQREHGKGFYA